MDAAEDDKKEDVRELVLRILATNFAAIHTSSNVSRISATVRNVILIFPLLELHQRLVPPRHQSGMGYPYA